MVMSVSERSKRQSFLGADSDDTLRKTTVAVIGVSGGGSPISQQLAHVGFGTVHLIDPDFAEEHHRHRLIGISTAAVRRGWKKVHVLRRLMRRVHPQGSVIPHATTWQEVRRVLATCDIVFVCVDGYLAREEIERYLRRFQIPLIDIGMTVRAVDGGYQICGQVILSMPGRHCMRCFGFLRDELLVEEAARYGDAGDNAQVVWPNGTLASTAVAMATALVLPWHAKQTICPYLVYDGNRFEMNPSPRLRHMEGITCSHFDAGAVPGELILPPYLAA
jgi:molybdopterin-synthase adenylyltransferase